MEPLRVSPIGHFHIDIVKAPTTKGELDLFAVCRDPRATLNAHPGASSKRPASVIKSIAERLYGRSLVNAWIHHDAKIWDANIWPGLQAA